MNRNRLRFLLIEKLERGLGIHLETKQLEYLFNEDENLLLLTPRRYGKDMLTAMRIAIKMIEKPGVRIGVAVPVTFMANTLQEKIKEMLDILLCNYPLVSITANTKNPNHLQLSNKSHVYMIAGYDFNARVCGQRFEEVYIMEPTCMANPKETHLLMSCCTEIFDESRRVVTVATPHPECDLLDDLMRNNYVTKIHATRQHSPRLSAQEYTSFRNDLDEDTYRSEILGEYRYN